MSDILSELRWRAQIAQISDPDGLAAHLAGGSRAVYCGFDPTADSLQIGNLVPILALARFQRAGHRPVVVVGGGTGLIGDPGGRTAERQLNPAETVRAWAERFRGQIAPFLDFASQAAPATMVDNADWLLPLSALELMRDVGKHFPVNVMLAKESVRARLEGPGISYTEFSYMLLQAFDYLHLARDHGCRVQIGGNDQWGNLIAGVDLIRRSGEGEAFALTVPLVTSPSGAKLGKTAEGTIWLDPQKTSPYAFYQYWLQVDDRDVVTFLKTFTYVDEAGVAELAAELAERPERRTAQRRLAEEVTGLVHGADELARARAASEALFGGGRIDAVDAALLEIALDGAPSVRLDPAVAPPPYADLLVATGLASSKSEAARLAAGGGVYANDERVEDAASAPDADRFLDGRLLVLRRGKRQRALVVRDGAGRALRA
jgi:tyrosyl-tRNA synthetase